jgi:signal transduction histidine kinase
MHTRLLRYDIRYEHDIVLTRQRARQICILLGFNVLDQTRVATAVSEIARNTVTYAGGGKVDFLIDRGPTPSLIVTITDKGPGISDLKDILDGNYASSSGFGIGIVSAKRLMDSFDIESDPSKGTTIQIGKILPFSAASELPDRISNVVKEMSRMATQSPFAEIQRQNQELLSLLDDLRDRSDDVQRLNQELSETNRGVVALYSELDSQAADVQRASEQKSNFLSNMSHEFRTPLASIISMSGILLSEMDGPLTTEQTYQINLIKDSSESLLNLVNELLDLAKIEAGKTEVHPAAIEVSELFASLRGMFDPLVATSNVKLVFEQQSGIPPLYTDEVKLAQILRNFVSNALKYTEHGSVTISAAVTAPKLIIFSVTDTGVGIAEEFHQQVFEEYTQIDGAHQRSKLGTGLGLPLARRLCEVLGGYVELESTVGVGSTFRATVPMVYTGHNEY